MPVLVVHTNLPVEKVPKSFMTEMTKTVAELLGKPESYVCVRVNAGQLMMFGGTDDPCAMVELESLGAVGGDKNKQLVADITKYVDKLLKIPQDRFYVKITDVPRSDLGFNGKTFG